jgi:hypothetical protein
MLSGHVFDPRFGFNSHFAFDKLLEKDASFRVIEFFANFGLMDDDLQLRVGHFPGTYTLIEGYSVGKLGLNARSFIFNTWNLGPSNGVALYRNKKKEIGFELSVLENGVSQISNKRRGVVAANVSYNLNELDPSDEMDFAGGPFRLLLSLGGFGRAQIETWKPIGYGGAFEAMAKVYGASIFGGFLAGVPETTTLLQSADASIVQEDIKNAKPGLGAYGQIGYVVDNRFGLAARYATEGSFEKAPTTHEILGSTSVYVWNHNVKFQIDGGAYLKDGNASPLVRGQLQLAF